jgi:hypothetical protein
VAWRFYRRKKILPGVSINWSRSGPSISIGPRGARFTIGPRGARETVGVPGTGISYTAAGLRLLAVLIIVATIAIAAIHAWQ